MPTKKDDEIITFYLIFIKLAQECSNMTLMTNDIERKKNIFTAFLLSRFY